MAGLDTVLSDSGQLLVANNVNFFTTIFRFIKAFVYISLPKNIILAGCIALGYSNGGDWSVGAEVVLVREWREILVVLSVGGGTHPGTPTLYLN